MKKVIVMLIACASTFALNAAISEKFNEGYDFKSLSVNTAEDETNISLFPDNQMFFLKKGKAYLSEFADNKESLLEAKKGRAEAFLGINGNVAYDAASGKMYFSVEESSDSEWLYEATYKKGSWTAVKRLEIEGMLQERGNNPFVTNAGWSYISKVKAIMQNPAIAKNGKRLYFTSTSFEDGQGGKDIWYIDLKADGTWTKPVNAGDAINTPSDEDYAFVENDEILYFSSNRAGVYNLYQSNALGESWANASLMQAPYNSEVNDYNIVIVEGVPYVTTDRNEGNGTDIYAYVKYPCQIIISNLEIIQEFTGTAYALEGDVNFAYPPTNGEIKVKDATGAEKSYTLPQTSPFKFYIDNIDCDVEAVNRNITVSFTDENCEATLEYLAPAEIKKEFYWVDFFFEFDKSDLTPQSQEDMERLVVEMKKFPDAKFEISGYADARGSNEYNDRLSERRAKSVKEALIQKGLKSENLRIIGKGERFLHVRDAVTEDQHAQNRRVEVRIINTENE